MIGKGSHRLGLIGIVSAACVTGCGFIFTHGPPQQHDQLDYFTCTESNTGPIIDVIVGGLNALGTVAIAVDPDSYSLSDNDKNAYIASGVIWTGVLAGAAYAGFSKTSRCRDAKRQLALRGGAARPSAEVREPNPTPAVQTVQPPPRTDVPVQGECDRRVQAPFGVPSGARAARTYRGGTGDDVVQVVLRAMTGADFHTTPSRSPHSCFAAFDGARDADQVTVYVCEAEDPVSQDLRWELTVLGPNLDVVSEVRAAIDGQPEAYAVKRD